jgi:hypothetical protein
MQEVHLKTISLGDCEDPQLYIAFPAIEFEKSPAGKWLFERDIDVFWRTGMDLRGYTGMFFANMTEEQRVEWMLKFG